MVVEGAVSSCDMSAAGLGVAVVDTLLRLWMDKLPSNDASTAPTIGGAGNGLEGGGDIAHS